MMNSSNKFTKDIAWKLLSLAIAIGLWFMVINTENPLEIRSYTASIQVQNEQSLFDRGYVAVNSDEIAATRIVVRLRGQRLALDSLSQSSTKVQAIVDLNNVIYSYRGEPVSVPVNIVIPSVVNNSFEILSKSTQSVMVDIQPYINEDFNVKTVVRYEGGSDNELIQSVASPGTITAYGAKSIINSIAEVRAEIALDTVTDDMIVTAAPVAYDAEGNVVDKVKFSTNELSIKIDVDSLKPVTVETDTVGIAEEGHVVTGIRVVPESVSVAGSSAALEDYGLLVLPSVDISGADKSFSTTYNVDEYLPVGVRTAGGSAGGIVTVTVEIEEEKTKQLELPPENIACEGELDEGLRPENRIVNVEISGAENNIDKINPEDITAVIDISGCEEGTYDSLPVEIGLPDNIEVVLKSTYVEVTIGAIEETSSFAGDDL